MVINKSLCDAYASDLSTLAYYGGAKNSDVWAALLEESLDNREGEVIILSAIPNSIIVLGPTLTPMSQEQVKLTLASRKWSSAIGHESTAEILSKRLGDDSLKANRKELIPSAGDTYICCLFTPPRRLEPGEKWSETEILNFPINFLRVDF
jgi:hypothetical protein